MADAIFIGVDHSSLVSRSPLRRSLPSPPPAAAAAAGPAPAWSSCQSREPDLRAFFESADDAATPTFSMYLEQRAVFAHMGGYSTEQIHAHMSDSTHCTIEA